MKRTTTAACLLAAALTGGLVAPAGAQQQAPDPTLLLRETSTLPLTGAELVVEKYLTAAGEIVPGQGAADGAAAIARERDAVAARYGKKDAALTERLVSAAPGERIPVVLWLDLVLPEPNRAADEQTDEARIGRAVAAQAAAVLPILERLGTGVQLASYAPVVSLRLPPAAIPLVERLPLVGALYLDESVEVEHDVAATADDATTAIGATRAWQAGNTGRLPGSDVRPANLSSGRIDPANAFLDNATHGVLYREPTALPGSHGTEVASVIASTHAQYTGVAPDVAQVISATYQLGSGSDDGRTVAAIEWASEHGADPINFSAGRGSGNTFITRYFDYATQFHRDTFTVSAGNDGKQDAIVGAPANAWSVIAVGATDDKDTGTRADDKLAAFSDHVNPAFAPTMEKPEVVAPGVDVDVTGLGGVAEAVDGTSFAAPAVAGEVALVLSRAPGVSDFPETAKAIVLATAWHDVVGGAADRSKDGVGAVDAGLADVVASAGTFRNGCNGSPPLCTRLGPAQFPQSYPNLVTATAGQRVRVALSYDAWAADPTTGVNHYSIGGDLDLTVRGPSGSIVGVASSVQNAWEVVEFTAPETGVYRAEVSLFSSEPGWPGTFLGIAASTFAATTPCTNVPSLVPGTPKLVDQRLGTTWFDSYPGSPVVQGGREKILKIALRTTKDLTITTSDGDLDLHLFRLIRGCPTRPADLAIIGQTTGTSMTIQDLPSGTYYLAVDGVGADNGNITATTSGP